VCGVNRLKSKTEILMDILELKEAKDKLVRAVELQWYGQELF